MTDSKLEVAKKVGADVVVNIRKENAEQVVKSLTKGYGCDVYIECTGAPPAVLQGLNLLRKLGRFIEYSVFKDPVSVDWSIISDDKALTVYFFLFFAIKGGFTHSLMQLILDVEPI